jgi:hypothetical protein
MREHAVPHRARRVAAVALVLALAAPLAALTSSRATTGSVDGVVFDSLVWRPLAGARVQLVTEPGVEPRHVYSATTDEHGRFRIADVEVGSYVATFFHPLLDSLGLEPPLRRAVVRANAESRVDLATPSVTRLVRAICPRSMLTDSASLLVGHVRDARSLAGVAGAELALTWSELVVGKWRVMRTRPELHVWTDAAGWFAVCNPPTGIDLLARAGHDADTSGYVMLDVPPRSVAWRDLFVGPFVRVRGDSVVATVGALASAPTSARSARDIASAADGAPARDSVTRIAIDLRTGTARLRGVVRSTQGQPLAGARIGIWGTGAHAVTNDSGAFTLGELPAGSYTLEAKAIGYLPQTTTVDLTLARAVNDAEVRLLSVKQFLDTVKVVASVPFDADENGFARRRKMGNGHFFDRASIAARHPLDVTDLLAGIPTIKTRMSPDGPLVLMRGLYGREAQDNGLSGGTADCLPNVYVDGLVMSAASLDVITRPVDIEGVEVYTKAEQVPAQFHTGNGCGVIVIWTSKRRLQEAPTKR